MEKITGSEFQKLGNAALYETINGNPEYVRILNDLREKGDFDPGDATELKKEEICSMVSGEDRDICCKFLEVLERKYIEKLMERTRDPAQKLILKEILELKERTIKSEDYVDTQMIPDTKAIVSIPEVITTVLTTEYQAELNHSRDLINSYKYKEALKFLEKLKERIWSNAELIVKYGILKDMGAAKLGLGREQEAADLLLEALQYNPDDEKALCNAAFGYLLLHQLDKAKTHATEVIEKNPANTRAYSIIIQASSEDENLEDIISKVPEPYRCNPEAAYAISHLARKRENLTESKKWLEIAVENDKNNWPDLKGSLGERLLELVMKDQSTIYGTQISDEQKNQINRTIELLTQAWNRVADTDLRNLRSAWIANRGIARKLLGDIKGAIKDIDLALDLDPNPVYKKYRALLASEDGDNERAIQLLEEIQSAEETPEAPLFLAMVLRNEKRSKEAIDIINDFVRSNPPKQVEEKSHRLLIQLYIDIKDFENAMKISDSMRESDPKNILNLAIAAWIMRMQNENAKALSFLNEAKKYVDDSTSPEYLVELANEFYYLEQFDEAANIYEKVVDKTLNTSLTRQLLISHYEAGELGKALEMCQTLHQKHDPLEYVFEMEAAIQEEIGDLPEAKKICQEYLEAHPENFGMRLRLALLNLHSNDLEKLDEFLRSPIDIGTLSQEHGKKLALLYTARNQDRKVLEIMYEMRRRYFNNSDAHLDYFHSFLQIEKENEEWLNPSNVCVNTVVCIEDSSGKTEWYTIEDREDADIRRREFNKDHQIARKLLGKSVGDDVLLRTGKYSREIGKIVEIKSKFVQAFQEIQNSYEKQFPDKSGLWQIKWERPERKGGLPKKIEEMFRETTKEQVERCQIIEQFYQEGKITLGIFAHFVGRNVLEVWGNLMGNPELGIKCCSGTSEEKRHALSLLKDNPRLIVDAISLMTLYELGAGDTIVKVFGKLGIAQSTADLLQRAIWERKGAFSRGHITVGIEGDNLVKQVVSAEDVERSIKHFEGALQWIEDNCEIVPYKAALKIRRDKKEQLEEILGESFVDTVLVAGEPGNVFYSDDMLLRHFAKSDDWFRKYFEETEFNVDGVWTQAVLMYCLNSGFLERDSYNKMIVRLVCSHYYFTSIDADVLIEAARQSNWIPSEPFKTVSGILKKTHDENSAINVSADFFFDLWRQQVPVALRNYLVLEILDVITDGRNKNAILDDLIFHVKRRFSFHVGRRFLVLPVVRRVISLIDLWKKMYMI
ncbi:MAG: hypothetical protein AYK18_14685 [Theionarchaea archaeon DG-70]|nr:MAG: hypothetical protein AYK18_14685 [Theionarchaea archaeon DG-70]